MIAFLSLSQFRISKMITFILKQFDFGFCQRMEKCLPMATCIDACQYVRVVNWTSINRNVRRQFVKRYQRIGTVATAAAVVAIAR